MSKRIHNNTLKCIDCGASVPRKVKRCPDCNKIAQKNKVQYVRSDEHKTLMSKKLKGRKHYWEPASKRPEVAEKIRSYWTEERKMEAKLRGLKMASDQNWREKIAVSVSGAKNPRWQDGHAVREYTPGFGRKTRQLAWERAGHKCEICGSDNPRDTHHIDFQKNNHSLENLQVLCRKCHKLLHAKQKALQAKV